MSIIDNKNIALNPYLALFTEKIRSRKVEGANFIVFSEFREMYVRDAFLNTSIKYVVNGRENYCVDNTNFRVNAKHFFISPPNSDSAGFVKSSTPVKGISIDLDSALLKRVFTQLKNTDILNLDNALSNHFSETEFFESVMPIGSSALSTILLKLEHHILGGDFELLFITDEWFFNVAEALITEQYKYVSTLNKMPFARISTRKEILRRLLSGRDYIEANLMNKMSVKEIAHSCFMAEFHFFRCFRETFGVSPLQYITKRRMEKSYSLLVSKKFSVKEVSEVSGYADIHSFSKIFRKYYGFPPSLLIEKTEKDIRL